jgi:TRAP-type C4-dicarboxylate transport system permease small subunit
MIARNRGTQIEEHAMKKKKESTSAFMRAIYESSRSLNMVAGISLTFLMCLTIADVILRHFRMPIKGTYELVAFSGAVVIGFSLPLTSWLRGHIFVDFFVLRFSKKVQNIYNVVTRCLVIVVFLLIGWNLFKYAMGLRVPERYRLPCEYPSIRSPML